MTTAILITLAIVVIGIYEELNNRKKRNFTGHPAKPQYEPEDMSEHTKLMDFREMKTAYIYSSVWNDKRKSILKRANYTCEGCGCSEGVLSVHHLKDYKLIPNEKGNALVALCESCHQYQHDYYGYPSTYAEYMEWNAPLLKDN